jgi:nucleotide sugar dehydrogenase
MLPSKTMPSDITTQTRIGFIGQGYIGKNYADDFERRGYKVTRYSLEKEYVSNRNAIAECDIVFIAVPTPTTPEGFDDAIVRDAFALVGKGKIAVVKSTILPGRTKTYKEHYPDLTIFYSPEFLSEATAAEDAAHPFSNILGMSKDDEEHRLAAERVHAVLPKAPFTLTCDSTEAELVKYSHNGSGYVQIIFFNLMYDLAHSLGVRWEVIEQALRADPYIPNRYARPVHKSGRGAGGHCFIKDFAALRELYEAKVGDVVGEAAFKAFEQKNISLLKESGKDLDLLDGVYGSKP